MNLIQHKAPHPPQASDGTMYRTMSPVMTVPDQITSRTSRRLALCFVAALCAVPFTALAWPQPAAARGSFSLHAAWSSTPAPATAARPVRAVQVARPHSTAR